MEDDVVQIQERAVSEEIKSTINDFANDVFVGRVKEGVIEEMQSLGATVTQTEALKEVVVNFEQQPGTSMAGSTSIAINVPQVLRKAFDAVQGLKMDESEMPRVIETIMMRTIAHELGHMVDQIMGILSNAVERDERWGPPEESEENRSERFAEFIGVSKLAVPEAELSQKERLLNVAKSAELWKSIGKYNAQHSQKVGLDELLAGIEDTFNAASAKAFVTSRKYLYSTARPENYAMPYMREQIQRTRRVE